MIIGTKRGDILASPYTHILFAVNSEGVNDAGFANVVARKYWPELARTGPQELGTVLTKKVEGGRVLHALVCHSLKRGGWKNAQGWVEKCLETLDLPQQSAILLIGSSQLGLQQGADVFGILGAMARSRHQLIVYTK